MSAIEAIKNGDAQVVQLTAAQAVSLVGNIRSDMEDGEADEKVDELDLALDQAQGDAKQGKGTQYVLIEITA